MMPPKGCCHFILAEDIYDEAETVVAPYLPEFADPAGALVLDSWI